MPVSSLILHDPFEYLTMKPLEIDVLLAHLVFDWINDGPSAAFSFPGLIGVKYVTPEH